jgi:predicted DCC family thiol-disulfide oxidoreductase YuxK
MGEIHGVYPDGQIIKGVDVFVATYQAVGLGCIFAPTRWPVLKTLFDTLYLLFARYRLRLGLLFGTSSCRVNKCIGKN